jgi:hypothetical protein
VLSLLLQTVDAYKQPELAPLFHSDVEDEGDKVVLLDRTNQPTAEEISLWDARGKDIVPLSFDRLEDGDDTLSVNHDPATGPSGPGGHSTPTGR